jgi:hypothetical protein
MNQSADPTENQSESLRRQREFRLQLERKRQDERTNPAVTSYNPRRLGDWLLWSTVGLRKRPREPHHGNHANLVQHHVSTPSRAHRVG